MEDHCYILLNDNIIVDPTIRQFLIDTNDDSSDYSKYILDDLPPIFVGTNYNLTSYLQKIEDLHNNSRQNPYSIHHFSNLNRYWKGETDVTDKFTTLIDYIEGNSKPKDIFNQRLIKHILI